MLGQTASWAERGTASDGRWEPAAGQLVAEAQGKARGVVVARVCEAFDDAVKKVGQVRGCGWQKRGRADIPGTFQVPTITNTTCKYGARGTTLGLLSALITAPVAHRPGSTRRRARPAPRISHSTASQPHQPHQPRLNKPSRRFRRRGWNPTNPAGRQIRRPTTTTTAQASKMRPGAPRSTVDRLDRPSAYYQSRVRDARSLPRPPTRPQPSSRRNTRRTSGDATATATTTTSNPPSRPSTRSPTPRRSTSATCSSPPTPHTLRCRVFAC